MVSRAGQVIPELQGNEEKAAALDFLVDQVRKTSTQHLV
jgi:hypothetical protein